MKRWLALIVAVVLLDQLSKQLAEALLVYHQPLPVLPSFNLTLGYNTGAAFSFLADQGGWQRWFFVVLAIVVSVFLGRWLREVRDQPWLAASLSLILGGAIGNVIDRAFYGHVIDFIDLYYDRWHWPIFNVADIAISCGVVLLVVLTFRSPRNP
ncbi:signal peptidase II [Alkalilimnicola sp. S0819]|uniref:signal peptidase II n=1 Tax=Alkalilimnicola sp. S0819 TaxID=2613922 RepID=UPI001261ED4E|nr:signal peptidase II [Alkalilimnicola sp. S0819]KAB7623147.1 lipoprotein signal peptidase [Alkalilimnicola sp. S0819]MPQ16991.1 lipoprotein signal peptidase [Alkalilimnicola sp. S0819]